MESVFPSFFFNTKYSSLLKDEHHVVGSQNINKSWTLINSKNLLYSIISTTLNYNTANRAGKTKHREGWQSPVHPPGHVSHPSCLTFEVSAGTRVWDLSRTPGAEDLEGRMRWQNKREQVQLTSHAHSSVCPRDAFEKPARQESSGWMCHKHTPSHGFLLLAWTESCCQQRKSNFFGSSTSSKLHNREL